MPHPRFTTPLRISVVVGIAVVLVGSAAMLVGAAEPTKTPRILAEFPHDPNAFCQGLLWDGELLEGTGQLGASTLRRVDLATGKVQQQVELDASIFGEGIAVLGDELFQLTWRNQLVYVYNRKTLAWKRTLRYPGEAWGLTTDGQQLILSDGTPRLRFVEPTQFVVQSEVTVRSAKGPVNELNELEFIDGEVWANIWHSDRIARINPTTGRITGWVDLAHLYPRAQRPHREAVLNGIAFDPDQRRLFVTGKHWPKLYELRWQKP